MNESQRCLILAPTGNDSSLITEALGGAGLAPQVCLDLEQLCREIDLGAGMVIIAQEAVDQFATHQIRSSLERDQTWSVLPFVLLISAVLDTDLDIEVIDLFGPNASIALVERPCRTATLISAVRSALNARQRQYELRSLLGRLDDQTQELGRSNAELQRFAAAAAHDLQAPLRLITNYLSLIQEHAAHCLDQRSRDYLDRAVDGAGRMRELILALLEYASVGASKPEFRTFPAEEALGEALHNLSLNIEEARPEIRIGDLPEIRADRTLIALLFQNLVGNALKYRAPETRLEIEIIPSHHEREWIFTISDTGIGISADDFERIFGAFQRLHGLQHVVGHGIGLATCKRIVDLHGGRIWVESTPEVGSRFSFSLAKDPQ